MALDIPRASPSLSPGVDRNVNILPESSAQPDPAPVRSLLDTDLYKLTMQQAVLRHYPAVDVAYKFTNRTPAMLFTRRAVDVIRRHVARLSCLALTPDERAWLEVNCPYLDRQYLDFLQRFRFDPDSQVEVSFQPVSPSKQGRGEGEAAAEANDEKGQLGIKIRGRWLDVILYEVPLMAIVSEVYFGVVDTQWSLAGQYRNAFDKATRLVGAGIRFSEFGTRRRRSYETHRIVLDAMVEADRQPVLPSFSSSSSSSSAGKVDGNGNGNGNGESSWHASSVQRGKLLGTSNVHFAMLFNLVPIGTVAHEWTMAVAALEGYSSVNLKALKLWDSVYSPPGFTPNSPTHDLTIALTDTFSTDVFWSDLLSSVDGEGREIARRWRGLRQDSGDSKAFALKATQVYKQLGIDPLSKVVVYSDALTVQRCIDLAAYSTHIGIGAGFGIGTNLTNDFRRTKSRSETENPESNPRSEIDIKSSPFDTCPAGTDTVEKSQPLNIVIKLDSVAGQPVVKISDDLTKNTGDPEQVKAVKRRFGIPLSLDNGNEDHNEHVEYA
ncbi:nicotinate phosphoribosyltransferase [Testicularia cyperi]|uniref:Nicotinate phosphoribosyltransferase n=1 Tax=Testicularia cyperi TaxID=1882483 RepID=A0A317XPZ1_9BASI|nr:nicotinate phosphoribosyltransferase [Testicularia cyperi]